MKIKKHSFESRKVQREYEGCKNEALFGASHIIENRVVGENHINDEGLTTTIQLAIDMAQAREEQLGAEHIRHIQSLELDGKYEQEKTKLAISKLKDALANLNRISDSIVEIESKETFEAEDGFTKK